MNSQYPLKWWSTLKSAVFGLSSSLPPLVGGGGGLVTGVLFGWYDWSALKQSMESVYLSLTCHPSPRLTRFAFMSSEVRRLLLDLDIYGGIDPLDMFSLFLERTADVLAPSLCSVSAARSSAWVVSRCAGDRSISLLIRKVHRPTLLISTNRFPWHQYCLRCLSGWCRFVSDDLWNAV